VAVSPGVGFGPGGDGHVRFALVENEQRINQATRNIRRLLQGAGPAQEGAVQEVTAPSDAEPT
jgi:alanine-synthesizing transaminase